MSRSPAHRPRYRTPAHVKLAVVSPLSLVVGLVALWPTFGFEPALWVFLGVVGGTATYLSRKPVNLEVLGSGLLVLAVGFALTPVQAYATVTLGSGSAGDFAGTALVASVHWLLSWGVAFGALALASGVLGRRLKRLARRRRERRERRRAKSNY